jgi:signal peptidase I
MDLVQVTGISMKPYLKDGDLLLVDSLSGSGETISKGQLVLVLREEVGYPVMHRVVAGSKIKGDRTKQDDNSLPGGLKVIGVAKGRVTSSGVVPYSNNILKFAHLMQAWLSNLNRWENKGLHRVSVAFLIVLGWCLRRLEHVLVKK